MGDMAKTICSEENKKSKNCIKLKEMGIYYIMVVKLIL